MVLIVTGRVFYNPWTQDVFEFPTFVQTADYTAFTVNSKDGSIFNVDPMISFRVQPGKSPEVFRKYRKDIETPKETVILTYVRDAFKNVFNTYSMDSVLSRREEFDLR